MKAILRMVAVLATLAATAATAAAGAGGARAAGDLIGGILTVGPTTVTLTSTATIPIHVSMATDGPFTVEPATFDLQPAATQKMRVVGDAAGSVSAALVALVAPAVGDASSVTLVAHFNRPPGLNVVSIALTALAAIIGMAGLAVGLRRYRPWELRLRRGA